MSRAQLSAALTKMTGANLVTDDGQVLRLTLGRAESAIGT